MPWAMIAAIGALAGGAGGLMSGMGFGGGDEAETPPFIVTNPSLFDLASIFGQGVSADIRGGGFFPSGQGSAFSDLPNTIRDYAFNPLPLSPLEQGARTAAEGVLGRLPELTDLLRGLIPGALDLANTGFRTPIQPAVDFATETFREDLLPMLLERAGGGLASSSFLDSSMEQARRLATELGVQDIGLSESAAGRRVQGLPLAANLIGASAAFPINISSDLAALGGAFRRAEEERRSRPISVFSQLAGLGPQQGFQYLTGGYPTTNTTAATIGALSEAIPAIINSWPTSQPTTNQAPWANTTPYQSNNPLAPNNLFNLLG